MFTDHMRGALRLLVWVYLLVFSGLVVMPLVIEATQRTLTLNATANGVLMFLPVAIVVRYLRKLQTPITFVALSPFTITGPIFDAHKFRTIEHVELSMYLWFVPMLMLVILVGLHQLAGRKHNR